MPYTDKIHGIHWTVAFGLPLAVLIVLIALAGSALGQTRRYLYILDGAVYEVEPSPDPDATPIYTAVEFPMDEPEIPTGATNLPSGFADFDLSSLTTNTAPDTGAPEVAEWTRQSQPDDTMSLTSEGISNGASFVFAGVGAIELGDVQKIAGRQAVVTLPGSLLTNDMYLAWGINSSGFGEPFEINKTELWWLEDETAIGETFAIYGQNLDLGDGLCQLFIVGHGFVDNNGTSNPYRVEFDCPTLANGTYTVYAHNGHGQHYGWSEPLTLTVIDDQQDWTRTPIDVTAYGAIANDGLDDLAAINSAIAGQPEGATIYFPTGTFNVSSRIYIGSGRRIKGAGMDETVITSCSGFESEGSSTSILIAPHTGGITLEDLELNLGTDYGASSRIYSIGNAYRGVINRVRFSHLGMEDDGGNPSAIYQSDGVKMDNAEHISFNDCEFVMYRPVNANYSTDVHFNRCNFYGYNDCNVMVYASGAQGFALIDCTMESYDDSDDTSGLGWGKGRWVSGHTPKDFYMSGCHNIKGTPRDPGYFQTGLAPTSMTVGSSDGSVTEHTLQFSGLTRNYIGADGGRLLITSSTGGHSLRSYRIDSYNKSTGTVVIDVEDWAIDDSFFQNTNFVCSLRDYVDQNSGEHLMFEGCYPYFRDTVTTATASTATFTLDPEKIDKVASIVKGRGQGQSRRVASVSGYTITLEDPWRVIPDSSSVITGGRFGYRGAVYDNVFAGDPRTVSEYTATAAFSSYGAYTGAIVDGNTISNLTTGIMEWSLTYKQLSTFSEPDEILWGPNYFGLYQNNTIGPVYTGMASIIKTFDGGNGSYLDETIVGSVWRSNSVTSATSAGMAGTTKTNSQGGLVVMADNTLTGLADGIDLETDREGFVLIDNDFTGSSTGVVGRAYPLLLGNTFTGFSTTYGGTLPGAEMVIPIQDFGTNSTTHYCEVINGGTSSLSWTNTLGDSGAVAADATGGFSFDSTTPGTFDITGGGDTVEIRIGNYPAFDSLGAE